MFNGETRREGEEWRMACGVCVTNNFGPSTSLCLCVSYFWLSPYFGVQPFPSALPTGAQKIENRGRSICTMYDQTSITEYSVRIKSLVHSSRL